MTSLLADVSDKLIDWQSVVNIPENLNFARIYCKVIPSTYNKVSSFHLMIIESLGSLHFKLLNSNLGSSEVQRFNQTLIAQHYLISLQKLFRYVGDSFFHGLTQFIWLFNIDIQAVK